MMSIWPASSIEASSSFMKACRRSRADGTVMIALTMSVATGST